MMDFSKFRASGDLSDIKVVVNSQENNLHKFPLYARSDYFCELARSGSGPDGEPARIELKDFPGGNETFGKVADFCYNMSLDMNKNNVVPIRCAAEYLKMFGPGNLKDVSNKYLMDTVSAAKLNRSTGVIVDMLINCNNIGEIAKEAGVVDVTLEALVECWTKPGGKPSGMGNGSVFTKLTPQSKETASAFTRVQAPSGLSSAERLDEASMKSLTSLRVDWFANLLTKARIRGVNYAELGGLAVQYISAALGREKNQKSEVTEKEAAQVDDDETADDGQTGGDEKDVDTNVQNEATSSAAAKVKADAEEAEEPALPISGDEVEEDVDIGSVLDKIILILPEQAFSIPSVTMEWLTKVLRIATAHDCECRGILVRVAGEMLTKLGPEDLCIISPSVLHDIVVDADNGKNKTSKNLHSDRACKLVDTYMGQMTKKGILTAETFRLLASATINYSRQSHDSLYDVLEFVLKSENDKLTPEQRTELTDFVNFDLLSETSLQKALDGDIVPTSKIASSAIKLCSRLRSELASVKYIAEMQEEDIQKYQSVASVQSSKLSSSPPPIAEPRHYSAYSSRERNVDSGYADALGSNRDKSPLEALRADDLDSSDHQHETDPLKAAQSVLTAARHKLALPIYTGYRPALLTRLSPPTSGSHSHSHSHHSHRGNVEHDISLEEELEFKFDRTFRSLDPRVRHHRLGTHQHTHHSGSSQRTYFPYSNYSHRF